jgi:hypothetical protein
MKIPAVAIAAAFAAGIVLGCLPGNAPYEPWCSRARFFGPAANLFAVPLTGVIVPLSFFGLAIGSIFHTLAELAAPPLIPHGSYRIPGASGVAAAFVLRGVIASAARRSPESVSAQVPDPSQGSQQ